MIKLLQAILNADIDDRLDLIFSFDLEPKRNVHTGIAQFMSTNGTAVIFDKHCIALQIGLT